jgi:hypothetical protein
MGVAEANAFIDERLRKDAVPQTSENGNAHAPSSSHVASAEVTAQALPELARER